MSSIGVDRKEMTAWNPHQRTVLALEMLLPEVSNISCVMNRQCSHLKCSFQFMLCMYNVQTYDSLRAMLTMEMLLPQVMHLKL